MFIRVVNALLGLWLFVSAFMFPHTVAQFFNEVAVGLLVTGVGVAAIMGRGTRKVNFGLGVWLFISALVLPHVPGGSLVNEVVVAVLIVISSLFPSHERFAGMRTAP
jgi:hypothetical protein